MQTATEIWDSWRGDEVLADKESGRFLARPDAGSFAHHDAHFDIEGRFNVPRSPQGRPVIFQAGESEEGREFAAAHADAIFSRYSKARGGAGVLRRREGPAGPPRPLPRGPAHPPRGDLRARRHRRRGCRDRPRGASRAGLAGDGDQVPRAACGTPTCPTTTRTGRCRRSTPSPATTCSRRVVPRYGSTATRSRSPASGASAPRRTAGAAASRSSR
nr:hypothetical protein [Nocardioides convexus]